ncbi:MULTISPECIES: hypothetical protein [unclassified Pseudomonas]|uniref:hypothetical protein n=1 Tax=unclassified Pseudomonas TaxID=196821 RepID=UPI00244CDA43|nr:MULTISPECIES: hypothetical protein [unclassified Pseudomonas]MDG9925468.1 hypothetical protein [Pseudomonas sp. GD04045]MDH0034091.1 hypothetical protein [Pseudomonas sp. GD04019]
MSKVTPLCQPAKETARIFRQAILLAPNTTEGRQRFAAELIGHAAGFLLDTQGAAIKVFYTEDNKIGVAVGPISDVEKVSTEEAQP